METQSTGAPPSKRLKIKQEGTVVPSGKGSGKKFTNKHLPDGSHIDNTFRSVYVPSLVHWWGGHVDPWSVDPTKLQDAMQSVWNVVYRNRIEHEVTIKGPVYAVVSLDVSIVTC